MVFMKQNKDKRSSKFTTFLRSSSLPSTPSLNLRTKNHIMVLITFIAVIHVCDNFSKTQVTVVVIYFAT